VRVFHRSPLRKTDLYHRLLGGNGGPAIARLGMRVQSDREWVTATPKRTRASLAGKTFLTMLALAFGLKQIGGEFLSLEAARRYEFRYGVIQANAPRYSGVYALFRGEEWLYVGEADSIYIGLLKHLDLKNVASGEGATTSFAFEVCPPELRTAKLVELVFKYCPAHTERRELKVREH
jgi:hypothetical protein